MKRKYFRHGIGLVGIVVIFATLLGSLSLIGHFSDGFSNLKPTDWDLRERNEDNLLKNEFEGYNMGDGITATVDNYGVITLNGTYKGEGSAEIVVDTVNLSAGIYTISGDNKGSNYTYRLIVVDSSDKIVATSGLDTATFTLPSTATVSVKIEVFPDYECKNVKISPVLVSGDEAGEFFS